LLKYDYHIQMELSDLYNVLAVGTIGDNEASMYVLVNAIKDIAQKYGNKNVIKITSELPENQEMVVSPRFAFYSEKRVVPLEEAEGEISTEMLMAYPPGIPIICPGERITKEVIEYAKTLNSEGCHLQGTQDPDARTIMVLADKESVKFYERIKEVV